MKEEIEKTDNVEELKAKKESLLHRKEKKEKEEKNEELLKKDAMIETLAAANKELQDKLIMHQAEFANFKRRKEEETSAMLRYCNQDIALEILPVVDAFERAIQAKTNEETEKFMNGFKMIYNNLKNVLNKYEITEMDCIDKPFDHNYHQALMTAKVEGVPEGMVIEVLQKGYMIKDKLLRPALVKVSE